MYHPTGGIVAVESLAGRELATYVKELNEGVEGLSPTRRVFINQDVLEPILHRKAIELGATVRNRTEAVGLEQDDDGVTVTLRDLDSGDKRVVRARYVVAADGNRSPMRARLGIGMEGHGELSRSITIYFRADCAPLLENRNQGVMFVHNPELRGFFRLDRTGGTGFLVINTVGADVTRPEAVAVSDSVTEERARALLQTAIGTPDVAAEVLHIAHWRAEANAATRMRDGRVFLAGDAAHVVPPNGGYGGNTGVLDARNLAWKLAAVVKGEAGHGLLDSYEDERLPLGRLTVEQAYTRYATRVVPERGTDDPQPFIDRSHDGARARGPLTRCGRRRQPRRSRLAHPAGGGPRTARHARAARRARPGSLDDRPVRARLRPVVRAARRWVGAAERGGSRHRRRRIRRGLRPLGGRRRARATGRHRRLALAQGVRAPGVLGRAALDPQCFRWRRCMTATTIAPTIRPRIAEAAVLVSQAPMPPTAPSPSWTSSSRWWTAS